MFRSIGKAFVFVAIPLTVACGGSDSSKGGAQETAGASTNAKAMDAATAVQQMFAKSKRDNPNFVFKHDSPFLYPTHYQLHEGDIAILDTNDLDPSVEGGGYKLGFGVIADSTPDCKAEYTNLGAATVTSCEALSIQAGHVSSEKAWNDTWTSEYFKDTPTEEVDIPGTAGARWSGGAAPTVYFLLPSTDGKHFYDYMVIGELDQSKDEMVSLVKDMVAAGPQPDS